MGTVDHALSLTFDHAALVPDQSGASGADIRVLYRPPAGQPEFLPFVLDPDSRWGLMATRIWFRPAAPIEPGETVRDSYFLLYGNPSVSPMDSDENDVFLFFDEFGDGQLVADDWTFETQELGRYVVEDHALRMTTVPRSQQPQAAGSLARVHTRVGFRGGLAVETRSWTGGAADRSIDCAHHNMLALRGIGGQDISAKAMGLGHYLATNDGGALVETYEAEWSASPESIRYGLLWDDDIARFLVDSSIVLENTESVPSAATELTPAMASYNGNWCDSGGEFEAYFAWILIRRYLDPEPVAQLE